MKICGVELKANTMIFTIVEVENSEVTYIDTKIKKITLENDENKTSIVEFKNSIDILLQNNNIEKLIIKKRAKKGNFAGGAITFKMEAIIQLNNICDVEFVSGQAISKYQKQNELILPTKLNKYQEQAYLSVLTVFQNK